MNRLQHQDKEKHQVYQTNLTKVKAIYVTWGISGGKIQPNQERDRSGNNRSRGRGQSRGCKRELYVNFVTIMVA